MAEIKLPYVVSTGSLAKTLEKIQSAATPGRFTQDFLSTKLGLKGGSAKPVIPFLKRVGFLGTDGAPTDLYRRFRNSNERQTAAAEAVRLGYEPLYEANEYAHDLDDGQLKGLIVQLTGMEEDSRALRAIVSSFRTLSEYADFSADADGGADFGGGDAGEEDAPEEEPDVGPPVHQAEVNDALSGLNIGYTINLHLPATSDIAVFNAIFKSLRENLLR